MSTIRPLATIAVLAALGVFLALKINEEAPVAMQDDWSLAPVEGAAAPAAGASAESEAPAFSPSAALASGEASATSRSAPPTAPTATAASSPSAAPKPTQTKSPELPPLPKLPSEPAAMPQGGGIPVEGTPIEGLDPSNTLAAPGAPAANPKQASNPKPNVNPALALPARAAASNSAPASAATPPAQPTISGRVPSLGNSTPDLPAMAAPREAAPAAAPVSTIAAASAAPPKAEPSPSAGPAASAVGDRYASMPASTPAPDFGATDSSAESETTPLSFASNAPPASPLATPTTTTKPSANPARTTPAAGFAGALPLIQEALGRDELTRAHLMLSQWRDDPSLTLQQRNDVAELLDQLAGTVVYSMEHRLEPPHQVAAGETLASIAEKYNVPWPLLAKINGVANADAVKPGQTLKVVRGPFHAVVDSESGELVLMVDGRYAGRFPVTLEGVASGEGSWTVGEKAPGGIVLRSESSPGASVALGPSPAPTAAGRIAVASSDAAELSDILSVGSTVTVRR
ncbi:MAG: LysM peptidoglycan-binding domain-containing protein [Lacipirellulaceae bacterium]